MKTFITSFLAMLLMTSAYSQSLQKRFEFTGSAQSIVSSIKTVDDGFLLTGSNGNNNTPNRADIVLIRTDSNFNPIWTKSLYSRYSSGSNGFPCAAQPHLEYAADAIATQDGFLLVGTHDNRDGAFCSGPNTHLLGEFDIVVAKLDTAGDPVWTKRYGNTQTQMATSIIATQDGGFVISGFSNVQTAVLSAALPFLMKIDNQGNVQWSKRQHNFAFEGLSALFAAGSWRFPVVELQNGDLAYLASTGRNTYLVRLDAQGNLRWARNFYHSDATGHINQNPDWAVGAASYAFFHSLLEYPNGNLAIIGNLYFQLATIIDPNDPFGASFIIGGYIEADSLGNYDRSSIFSHPTGRREGVIYDLATTDVKRLPNGNLLIGGLNEGSAFMMEFDPSATQANSHSLWAKRFSAYHFSTLPFSYDLPSILINRNRALICYDNFKIGAVDLNNPQGACPANWGPIQSLSLTGNIPMYDVCVCVCVYVCVHTRTHTSLFVLFCFCFVFFVCDDNILH